MKPPARRLTNGSKKLGSRRGRAQLHSRPTNHDAIIEEIRAAVSIHVAALPVPYRTTKAEPTFEFSERKIRNAALDSRWSMLSPVALDPFQATRFEIAEFARTSYAKGVRYLGVCCGAGPHHVRALAEALGRNPLASRFSPDMSKHYAYGTDPRLRLENRSYARNL